MYFDVSKYDPSSTLILVLDQFIRIFLFVIAASFEILGNPVQSNVVPIKMSALQNIDN